ncbi:hypothetical protein [Streptomyces sp. NRRL S-448]|uniref:hypothetical protein n=1 Tax=Streptomyces sp. NRRL S-448 TaxID=1463907 RepID=UPI0035648497
MARPRDQDGEGGRVVLCVLIDGHSLGLTPLVGTPDVVDAAPEDSEVEAGSGGQGARDADEVTGGGATLAAVVAGEGDVGVSELERQVNLVKVSERAVFLNDNRVPDLGQVRWVDQPRAVRVTVFHDRGAQPADPEGP